MGFYPFKDETKDYSTIGNYHWIDCREELADLVHISEKKLDKILSDIEIDITSNLDNRGELSLQVYLRPETFEYLTIYDLTTMLKDWVDDEPDRDVVLPTLEKLRDVINGMIAEAKAENDKGVY